MEDLFLTFNYVEVNIILNWFEIANVRSERFGSSRYYFPQEEVVVQKLRKMDPQSKYDDIDFEVIWGWMEKAVFPRLGDGGIYFPNEKEVVDKLTIFRKKVDKFNALENQKKMIKGRLEAIEQSHEIHDFKYDANQFRQKLKEKQKIKTHEDDQELPVKEEKLEAKAILKKGFKKLFGKTKPPKDS